MGCCMSTTEKKSSQNNTRKGGSVTDGGGNNLQQQQLQQQQHTVVSPVSSVTSTQPTVTAHGGRVSIISVSSPYNGSVGGSGFETSSISQTTNLPGKYYIARYAYQARTAEDLSFEKGERLLVIGSTEGDWWHAKSTKSQREGYIPRNYVASELTFEAEE